MRADYTTTCDAEAAIGGLPSRKEGKAGVTVASPVLAGKDTHRELIAIQPKQKISIEAGFFITDYVN